MQTQRFNLIRILCILMISFSPLSSLAVTAEISKSPDAIKDVKDDAVNEKVISRGVIPTEMPTLGRLEQIQAETVLYEAQVARSKALKSLQESDGYVSVPVTIPGEIGNSNTVKKANSNVLPLITEIFGTSKDLRVRVLLQDGSVAEVRNNQRIPGTELTVKKTTVNEVIVSDNSGTAYSLSFNQ
jgi:type IV pilus biogenesis protein PilP